MNYVRSLLSKRFAVYYLIPFAVFAVLVKCSGTKTETEPSQTFTSEFPDPAGRALMIEDYYRIESIGSPSISPNGKWVAFSYKYRIEDKNNDRNEVWIVPADGSGKPKPLSGATANSTRPRWTADGLLSYSIDGTVWFIDVEKPGSKAFKDKNRKPFENYSPDKQWIAETRDVPPPPAEPVYVSDFVKLHEERFEGIQFDWMNFQRDGRPMPVPDARDPRVNPPAEIFISRAEDGESKQVTDLELKPSGVTWHPDGNELLFTADSHYRDEMTYGRPDIWTVTVDGEVDRLTDDGYTYGSVDYSPDGAFISYIRGFGTDMVIADKLSHGGPRDLFIMPTDGGAAVNLTGEWDLMPSRPTWSADGSHIYFTAGIGGSTHLFRVPVSGGSVEQVTFGQRRLGSLTFDKELKTMAFTVGRIEGPSEIYTASIDGSNEKQVTSMSDDFTSEITLSKAERLHFSSYDGTRIEGWLLYPYGYKPENGPYPLIVNSHGGPHSASGYSFNFKQQYFAANGYFVLQTNFRSSTGYGEEFKWATWGEWGTKDGQDVMSGVDYVIGHFPIDRNRVGTTGHSYGGFMTNWLITQYPDRFAAAVTGAGISNWVSDYGTADIARTKETEFYGTPWQKESRERLIKQSPLTYAGNVITPTLFVHGEVDHRVPFEEAEQFYTALKKNGVPAKVIRYAGKSHGGWGHWNNVHRIINELAWWEKYLKE